MRFYFDLRDQLAIPDEIGRDLKTPLCTQDISPLTCGAWNPTSGPGCPFRSSAKAISGFTRKPSLLRLTR
jgi:hypothetical protein